LNFAIERRNQTFEGRDAIVAWV